MINTTAYNQYRILTLMCETEQENLCSSDYSLRVGFQRKTKWPNVSGTYPRSNSSPSFANNSFTVPFKLLFSLQHLFVPWSLYSHNNAPLLTTEPSFTLNLTTTAFSGQFTTATFAIIARVLYKCKHQVSKLEDYVGQMIRTPQAPSRHCVYGGYWILVSIVIFEVKYMTIAIQTFH